MDCGDIERMIAAADAQEAGGLFEGLGTEAGDGEQVHAGAEAAVLVAILHDLNGGALGDAGDVAEEGPGSGVEVHADAVDAAFDGGFEALLEAALIHIVLILADADAFGVDLDEFGERVLEAAGDGDGAAHGEIEIGEFLAGHFGGGVDAGAGFADGDAEDVVEVGVAEEVLDEGSGFARGGAVADGDSLHVVAGDEGGEGFARAGDIHARFEGVDDGVFEELAGVIDHGDFAAGTDAGIEREHGHASGRRGEEQVLQILAEDLNGLFVRAVFQFEADFGLDGGVEEAVVGVFDGLFEVRGPRAGGAQDAGAEPGVGSGGIEFDLEGEHAFLGAAANGEHAVGGDFGGGLGVAGVHLELAFGIWNAFDGAAGDAAFGEHHDAHGLAEIGVLADHFGHDVAGALEGFHGGQSELGGEFREGGGVGLIPEVEGERFEALIAGDGCLGAALGLVGEVEVLELGLFESGFDFGFQFGRELALLLDGREYGFAAVFEIAEVFKLLLDIADLDFIEIAGDLLAIAGDEGDGGAAIEEFDDREHSLHGDIQQFGKVNEDVLGQGLEFGHGPVELL